PPSSLTHPATTAIHTLSLHDALPIWRLTRIVPQVRLLAAFDEPIEIIQSGRVESARVGGDPARLNAAALSGPYQDRAIIPRELRDRKSTRLNSSHVASSYAVFCLKKK